MNSKKIISTLLFSLTLIFASIFISCAQAKNINAAYENENATYTFYEDNSWTLTDTENEVLAKGTYKGSPLTNGVLSVTITELISENGLSPADVKAEIEISDGTISDGDEVYALK